PQPPGALYERLDRDDRRAPQRLEPKRRPLHRSGDPFRLGEQRDGARLHDPCEHRPADEHEQSGGRERRERGRALHQRRDDRRDDVARVAAEQIRHARVEKECDEESAAHDRDGQHELEAGLGDELHDDERPVGGGDERPALERRLQSRRVRHRVNLILRPRPPPLARGVFSEHVSQTTTVAPPLVTRERRASAARLFAGGCAAAAVVVLAGFAFELFRFGADDRAAAARLEESVRASFGDMTAAVERLAHAVTADPVVRDALASNPEADDKARGLFDAAARARASASDDEDLALTVYDNGGVPRAWAGRASDLPAERAKGNAAVFVTSTPLGLRLVYLEPIAAATPDRSRVGAVVVEHAIVAAPAVAAGGPGPVPRRAAP